MKIAVLDITGRNASQYNPSLCKALSDNLPDDTVILMSPTCYIEPHGFKYKQLLRLVPQSMTSNVGIAKRALRALESFINYFIVISYIIIRKIDILHIQWLVFIDYSVLENHFLSFLKKMRPGLKIFLTVHNIFPHDLTAEDRRVYQDRFNGMTKLFDGFIVHLESSKKELISSFEIEKEKVFVAYHGIYVGDRKANSRVYDDASAKITKIILFGSQTRYKGADLLIDALYLLPKDYLKKISVSIIGTTAKDLYEEYKDKIEEVNVKWINRFVSDEELYEAIDASDLILLPYRKISQSGALLLAMSYKKPILTSNLPSFKETLEGYPDNYFFEANSAQSLAKILIKYLDGEINKLILKEIIEVLNNKYSWDQTAKATIRAYGIR